MRKTWQKYWRQFVSVFAMYVIAISTILSAALAPVPASADPFGIICHSSASAQADETPAGVPAKPSKACDHCTMCGAAAPSLNAVDDVVAGTLKPARLLAVRQLDEAPRSTSDVATPHLARGPPLNA